MPALSLVSYTIHFVRLRFVRYSTRVRRCNTPSEILETALSCISITAGWPGGSLNRELDGLNRLKTIFLGPDARNRGVVLEQPPLRFGEFNYVDSRYRQLGSGSSHYSFRYRTQYILLIQTRGPMYKIDGVPQYDYTTVHLQFYRIRESVNAMNIYAFFSF